MQDAYHLVKRIKLVQEALIRYERTLSHACSTVDKIRVQLGNTVPMLQTKCVQFLSTLQLRTLRQR